MRNLFPRIRQGALSAPARRWRVPLQRLGVLVALVAAAIIVGGARSVPAGAESPGDTLLEAKGFAFDGPDLIDENSMEVLGDAAAPAAAQRTAPPTRGGTQVNDPALDNIQFFPNALPQPQRPFELSIQSETSMAAFGADVVVGFNNSADQPIVLTPANTLAFVHRFLSGVGVSHDGGRTWTQSSLPPTPGSPFTFGDPAVAVDRQGNFYYASLGADARGASLLFVGKSVDRGNTFQPGVTVAVDPGVDKEWIAVGPDPLVPTRDNVYVTWTSFQAASSRLMLGRSTDGAQTWTVSTLFAPVDNGVESAFIQFSNPVVDAADGRLYVPFLHGGDGDADFIKVLISDDGGQSFFFATFNAPGAPDPTALPNVTPGTLTDCGVNGGFRTVLHAGPDQGGGRFGLPRFRNATRLITQPSAAVQQGRIRIAYNASTSATFGDPNSRSEIHLVFSSNGGTTWGGPVVVAAATNAEPQHVHPTIAVARNGQLAIGYYTQLASGELRVDAVTARLNEERGFLAGARVTPLSPAFDLIPSNIPVPAFGPNFTTNYDRTIRPCYDIGEYMAATRADPGVLFAWGDNRNSWTSPPASPAAGTHSQPDVFATQVVGENEQ
jgi:hypothetical protein